MCAKSCTRRQAGFIQATHLTMERVLLLRELPEREAAQCVCREAAPLCNINWSLCAAAEKGHEACCSFPVAQAAGSRFKVIKKFARVRCHTRRRRRAEVEESQSAAAEWVCGAHGARPTARAALWRWSRVLIDAEDLAHCRSPLQPQTYLKCSKQCQQNIIPGAHTQR